MPLSKGPKIFHNKSSSSVSYTQRSTVLIFCFRVGITGLILFLITLSRTFLDQNCNTFEPKTVSVAWERTDDVDGSSDGSLDVKRKRHKVMGFVGIFTGFGSVGRRRALRHTWLPSDRDGLQRPSKHGCRLEEATGLAFRFIIGKTSAEWKMSVLRKEVSQHDDFILLDIVEEYSKLPYKTLAFFKVAYALHDSKFYVKADDNIYLKPDRLSLLLAKERPDPQTYLGCMKKGPVFTIPKLKWYEPMSYLLGSEYFLHALSAKVVRSLVALRNDRQVCFLCSFFRMFSNEDVTIGAWMLAMNVNHENNLDLCARECTSSSIAVWDIPKCSGLCNPESENAGAT